MRQLRSLFLALALSALASVSVAQSVTPVDFMRNNPRNVFSNPAFYTADFGYFDMGLGGINISLQNIGVKYDKFFKFNAAGQPVYMDLNKGVASMRRKNHLNTFVNVDLFNCGRSTKHGYFTFSWRFREMESLQYGRDLFAFVVNGNGAFMGPDNALNTDIGVAVKAYQEFNMGYQMSLTEKLNVGARVKFLMGYADAKSKDINLQLMTDPDTYALTATGNVDVRATIPYDVSMENGEFSIADARFNIANLFKNYGAGIDLGAEYKIDDHYGVAASINDLGFIHWNNFSTRFTGGINNAGSMYDEGSLVFAGLTPEQIVGYFDNPETLPDFLDTLVGYFDMRSEDLKGYVSGLNTTMMVRGYYDLDAVNRFSAQLTGYFSGIGLRPALTLAYTGSFSGKYDVVGSYTIMPGSYGNLGVGLSADLDGLVLYVASNNVLGFINPANTSNLNVQFGLSFSGGGRISREEKILLRDE